MSLDKIFGGWDTPPEIGKRDEISMLWFCLAAQKVGTPEQKNNNGLTQRRGEWTMLMDLYKRAKPKVVVEIGVAQGGTFGGWCVLGEPDATIIAIDRCLNDCLPRPGEAVDPYIALPKPWPMCMNGGGIYAMAKHQQTIKGINGWSYEPHVLSHLRDTLAGRQIDWLWTDSSHEATMFKKEFEMYWPLVAEGGVYCTHDVMPSKDIRVTKSMEWDRIKSTLEYSACFEFRGSISDDSMGIGVIIK